MEKIEKPAAAAVNYYYPLLKRYAERLIGNRDAAESIARKVLQDQYELNGLVPAKHLRQVLKTDVLNRCYYWEQAQIFVRPLIKAPSQNHLNDTEELDDNKTRF
jgi:hypothetical protein